MRRIDLTKAQAARSSTIRDINRQIVLNYVRDREPISRADIARITELQRSTVSTIVEELKTEGLIEEIGAGASTGGRRPTLLRLRAAGATAIGVDIKPSSTTIATSDLMGRVILREELPNSSRPDEMSARIIECVRDFAARDETGTVAGVGVSIPGLIDPDTGRAIYIPFFKCATVRLPKRSSAPPARRARGQRRQRGGACRTLVRASRSRRLARLHHVLVAEGIGTGIVFDGQIYRGERGAAGEFGHMIVGQQAPVACSCGNRDCWEAFSSERATVARYVGRTPGGGNGDGKGARHIGFSEVVERALGGEQAAIDSLTETAHFLGIGVSNMIVGLSPESVVIGGQITRAWPIVSVLLEETIQRSVRRGLPSARIVASTLSEPTLMGAISLVLARKFGLAED